MNNTNEETKKTGCEIILEYISQYPELTTEELWAIFFYYKFKAYLLTTMRYTQTAFNKKLRGINEVLLPTEELTFIVDTDSAYNRFEASHDIELAFKQLEPHQVETLKKYYFEGKTDMEIAQEWGHKRQNVNNIRLRAEKKMKKIMEKL